MVLSHTTPLKYEPVEVFMSSVDRAVLTSQRRSGWIMMRGSIYTTFKQKFGVVNGTFIAVMVYVFTAISML